MSPALVRLHNAQLGEASPPFLTRETETMHVQSIYTRSGGGSGGVQENTIIFIVVGVVCLFVILTGFYLVGRHAVSSVASRTPLSDSRSQSPITQPPCPPRERNISEDWKIWKIWRHTSSTELPVPPQVPIVEVSPSPYPPNPTLPPRAMTFPSATSIPRPSQARRVTSLSVTTSFSHSHITQEALNEFRVSAYDLDGDLETEMLNSARDDVWPGHVLAVGEGCGDVVGIEETMDARGNATLVIGGSVQGHAAHAQWKGSDYESMGACLTGMSDRDSKGIDSIEGETVDVGAVVSVREGM